MKILADVFNDNTKVQSSLKCDVKPDEVSMAQLPLDYEPTNTCNKCDSKMSFSAREMHARNGKIHKIPILRCSNSVYSFAQKYALLALRSL